MFLHTKDILAGLLFIAFALLFGTQLGGLEGVSLYFPKFIIILLTLGGIYLVIKGIIHKKNKERDIEVVAMGKVFVISVMSIAYVLLIPILGFFISTLVFLFLSSIVFRERDVPMRKSLIISATFTAILTLCVWFGFQFLLGVPTPEGFLF